MSDAPPIVGRICDSDKLLLGCYIPQPKFGAHAPIGLLADIAAHQRLRVDDAPIAKSRTGLERFGSLNEGMRVNGLEQTGAFEIG